MSNPAQVDVDFGIPQGSVLGPSLFIFYINDLQDRLRSTVRLFADDTIAYLTITSEDDAEHLHWLQEDLDKLAQWGEDWFMQFHPAKCTVLTVTNKRNPIVTEYSIRGQLLAAVTSARYLGVTITDKVNWSQHINSITNKANRTLGFLCRNLKISSISIKEQAYKTLVCPLVEYASPVWDPHHQTDIRKLECVQRRAARFILSSQHNRSSVTAMIQRLGWRSLEDRRRDARLTMLYKIDHELVAISKTDQQEDYDNLTTMPIKYHTVGLTSGRCCSSQELSEIGTPCHLTKPAWTHLKLLKLQSVSNKPPRLLLSFNLFLTYPDARLPLMHSTYFKSLHDLRHDEGGS